jgi:Tol biopolymer transport system component
MPCYIAITSRKSSTRRCEDRGALLVMLLAIVIAGGLLGCASGNDSSTGSSSSSTSAATTKVAYVSPRALNGSDAPDTTTCQDPLNCQIVFNIWTMNSDGSSQTPLTQTNVLGSDSNAPMWSPNGNKIAFRSGRALDGSNASNGGAANTNLWTMNSDGSASVALTRYTTSVSVNDPFWSPDGNRIAFVSGAALDGSNVALVNGNSNIWIINASGSGLIALTSFTTTSASGRPLASKPKWSPDGSRIVFSSSGALDGSDALNPSNNANIWIMNADGLSRRPLTSLSGLGGLGLVTLANNPVWSPDSTKIAFISAGALDDSNNSNSNKTTNIWVMNADGSGRMPITQFTAPIPPMNIAPVWSPDGRRLLFVVKAALDGSNAPSNTENIWVVNVDGSARTALTTSTNINVINRDPRWSSDGTKIFYHSDRDLAGSDNPKGFLASGLFIPVYNI